MGINSRNSQWDAHASHQLADAIRNKAEDQLNTDLAEQITQQVFALLSGRSGDMESREMGAKRGTQPTSAFSREVLPLESTESSEMPASSGIARYMQPTKSPHLYFLPDEAMPHTSPQPPDLFNVEQVRQDFPLLQRTVNGKPLIWFDNAATTQKPRQVLEALNHFYTHDNSNVHRTAHTLANQATNAYEDAREKVQHFINASSPHEIVFVRGTTEAINLVAQTYGRKYVGPGDEILLTTLEHHSNIVPWQLLCQEKGAQLRVAPINDYGEVVPEAFERLLGPRTRLVAISHVEGRN